MTRAATILLADDEAPFRQNVAERLTSRGYRVVEAGDGDEALARVRETAVDAVVLDVIMPRTDGLTVLRRLRDLDPDLQVVMLTGQGTVETVVEAMKAGAYHYLAKPAKLKELEMLVERAVEKTRLARQNRVYREGLRRTRAAGAGPVVAESKAMKLILERAEQLAGTDSPVLLEGETGTGKEVVASFLHRRSPRAEGMFSVVNCGALSESLIDAELFGYEKGAFTGATESRPGVLEVADGGTLLLDEIGDLPPPGQIRLLRFLEHGLIRRVGSSREQPVDARVLAATHRNLETEVKEGRFREDLWHRLVVFRLAIPPLRERRDDIVPLATEFLSRAAGPGVPPLALAESARNALLSWPWPGNVRELSHAIERAAFAARSAGAGEILEAHLALPGARRPAAGDLVTIAEAERRHVEAVLARLEGNRARAAEVLGISERHLYRLLQGWEVKAP
ncbi:MAG: sigma-54-dependent Fis family transcriptional regulator [Planctomycetes bacterium]|nr:sigma-54-dependent Fis family transcriptional regulator [Planctomycetota bacterium]